MSFKYKNLDIVHVDIESYSGKAIIRGVATVEQPVIGATYIIEPLDFNIKSETYPYDMCVCFESQIKYKL